MAGLFNSQTNVNATGQSDADVNLAVLLNNLKNKFEYGFDSNQQRRHAEQEWQRLGGEAKLNELMSNPAIASYMEVNSRPGGYAGLGDLWEGAAIFGGAMAAGTALGGSTLAGTTAGTTAAGGGIVAEGTAAAGTTAAGGGLTEVAAGSTPALTGGAGAGQGLSTATLGGTSAAASGSFDWGQWAESLNNPQSLLAIGSGVAGIVQGNQQQDQAALAAQAANPWGTSGGYALAGQQLQSLMKDPMQVAATDPSYQLRIQGAQRAMAGYGQDSGAMSIAGANASTDWYNQRLEQLGKLAGAGLNPAQAGQLQQTGYQQGVQNIGQGLGSFGYAAAPTAQTLPQG